MSVPQLTLPMVNSTEGASALGASVQLAVTSYSTAHREQRSLTLFAHDKQLGDSIMQQENSFATIESRLDVYGLASRLDGMLDLRIEEGQTVELDARDPIFKPHHVRLQPKALADLKRWIGVPDDAVRITHTVADDGTLAEARLPHWCAPHVAQPSILRENPEIQQHLHRYLFGHSDSVERKHLKLLEEYIVQSPIVISVFALLDIYISKRARLIIPEKTQVLFARYITIETTGLLDLKAPFARIDCAGMRRLPPFVLGSLDPTPKTLHANS
jgi:hypothetical protein